MGYLSRAVIVTDNRPCSRLALRTPALNGLRCPKQVFRLDAEREVPPRSSPRAMLFTHMLAAVRLRNDPGHIIRNGDDLELGTMSIGLSAQLFHDLHQPLVVAGNLQAALIQTWFLRTSRRRPIRPQIGFLERIRLPLLSQARKSLMAEAEPIKTCINDDLSHDTCSLSVSHHRASDTPLTRDHKPTSKPD